jgi:hypothetical protein
VKLHRILHCVYIYFLWHIDPFLGNDRETNNEIMTVVRQRPARNNGSTIGGGVFYVVLSEALSRDRPSSVSQSVKKRLA